MEAYEWFTRWVKSSVVILAAATGDPVDGRLVLEKCPTPAIDNAVVVGAHLWAMILKGAADELNLTTSAMVEAAQSAANLDSGDEHTARLGDLGASPEAVIYWFEDLQVDATVQRSVVTTLVTLIRGALLEVSEHRQRSLVEVSDSYLAESVRWAFNQS